MTIRQSLLALVVVLPVSAWAQDSQPDSDQPVVPIRCSQATQPESVVFFYMQELMTAPVGRVVELREEVRKWRGFVHDRLRKTDGRWSRPDNFKRKREIFAKHMQDAAAELKVGKTDSEKRQAAAKANAKAMQAALAWEDPIIRDYLVGLANLRTGNILRAQTNASDCIKAAPLVAAFHELYGMTLLANDRPMDAVTELTTAAKLRNDRDTLTLLKMALNKVPGNQITDSKYKAGDELYKQLSTSSSSSSGRTTPVDPTKITPVLPGKSVNSYGSGPTGGLLPTPSFDRLTFRQGVALPITKNTLLVDAASLEGATEIFVRINDSTVVPAKVKKLSANSKTNLPPLALVTVDGYEFTPVDVAAETAINESTRVKSFGLGVYLEMGATLRKTHGKISVAKDGAITTGCDLQPGEAAAPVLTSDDKLCGMLQGRTDVNDDDGGPAKFISIKELKPLLDQIKKSSGSVSSPKNITTRPAEGKTFTVVTIVPELFDK